MNIESAAEKILQCGGNTLGRSAGYEDWRSLAGVIPLGEDFHVQSSRSDDGKGMLFVFHGSDWHLRRSRTFTVMVRPGDWTRERLCELLEDSVRLIKEQYVLRGLEGIHGEV